MATSEHRQALDDAAASIGRLRTWSRGGSRAPHKPLLLLLALRGVTEGHDRLVAFPDIERELRDLIARFSDFPRRADAGLPFWRLQADGLWEVEDAASIAPRQRNGDPPLAVLRSKPARGGFPHPLDAALRAEPAELRALAALVVSTCFRPDQAAEAAAIVPGTSVGSTRIVARSPAPPVSTIQVGSVEEAWVETFQAAPTDGGTRSRTEAQLVRRYAAWMEGRGAPVQRLRFTVPGEASALVCDAYVPDRDLLVEAKARDLRNSIRLAIGQLIDYRRLLPDPDRARLAVLFPGEPAPDHQALLRSAGIGWIWPDDDGGFTHAAGEP